MARSSRLIKRRAAWIRRQLNAAHATGGVISIGEGGARVHGARLRGIPVPDLDAPPSCLRITDCHAPKSGPPR